MTSTVSDPTHTDADRVSAYLDDLLERARAAGHITPTQDPFWYDEWVAAHWAAEGQAGLDRALVGRAENEYLAGLLGGVRPEDLADVRSSADALTPRGFAPNPTLVRAVADRIMYLSHREEADRTVTDDTAGRDPGTVAPDDDERRPGKPAGFLARIRAAAQPVTGPIGKGWTKTKAGWSNLPFGWKVAVVAATIAVGPLGGAAALLTRKAAQVISSAVLRATVPDRARGGADRDAAEDLREDLSEGLSEDLSEDLSDTFAPGVEHSSDPSFDPSTGIDIDEDVALDPVDAVTPPPAVAGPVPSGSWTASELGEPGAVAPASASAAPSITETSTPSIVQGPPRAPGRAATDDFTQAQRHLVDKLKVAYIEEFGLAVTDGDTTTFVSADSHPGIRSDERVVDPVKLQVLANRVESHVVTEHLEQARQSFGADLGARSLADYSARALAELGLEQGTVEVTVLRPMDPGVGR